MAHMIRKGRILIVDDEKDIRTLIREILEDEGYDVHDAPHSEAAYAYIASAGMPDLVILDIWLENSDRDGMEILGDLKKRDANLPVLMISGHGNIENAVGAIKLGAYDFIEKPFNTDRLLHLVARAMEAGQSKREGGRAKLQLVSEMPDMQAAIKLAAKAASGDGRVLITGPQGAGRHYMAAWIHQESGRGALGCVSVRADGLDSAALERAMSKAGAGTLIIRDVANLPEDTQKTLLRLISGKTECRIISTAVAGFDGRGDGFLADLYDRLAVSVINVTPLSSRRLDVANLATQFVREYLKKWGITPTGVVLSDDGVAFLQNMRFGSHMAELQSVCAVAAFRLMQSGGQTLLPEHFQTEVSQAQSAGLDDMFRGWLMQDLRVARESFERWYFDELAERFEGNISAMATFAGMDRTALHRKLKSLKGDGVEVMAS